MYIDMINAMNIWYFFNSCIKCREASRLLLFFSTGDMLRTWMSGSKTETAVFVFIS